MAMNRQQKRMMQKAGQLGADGEPQAQRRKQPNPAVQVREERPGPVQFLSEVRSELRKVAWPTRPEVVNFSVVVLVFIIVLTALIAALDYFLGDLVLRLFQR